VPLNFAVMSKSLKKNLSIKQASLLHFWLVKHFYQFWQDLKLLIFQSIFIFLERPPGKLAEALAQSD
jgi:hypothetical protein